MKKIKPLIVKFTVWLASFLYRGVKYKPDSNSEGVKVNLGCGLRCLPDWINVDGSLTSLFGSERFKFVNELLYKFAGSSKYYSFDQYNEIIQKNKLKFYDLRKGVPVADNSADFIYTSHFIEHLTKRDGKIFMKECYKKLKKGGVLRIAVPNLDVAFEMYKNGDTEKMLDLFFYTSDIFDFSAHKYNYNFKLINEILSDIGFKNIVKTEYQSGKCPNIDFLDIYPEHSLYIECAK
jgi:predicted SAM-dependent methyltransferase